MTAAYTPQAVGLLHPEWVNGRRLWMDTAMRDLIHKVRFGDPVRGWEGDERLAVYWNGDDRRWELWRLEDDNQYRFVCRSQVNDTFDERVIDALLGWDRQRRSRSLHDEIVANNDRLDGQRQAEQEQWIAEDLGPRLRHAMRKDDHW